MDVVQDDQVQDEKVGRLRLENDSVLIVASVFPFWCWGIPNAIDIVTHLCYGDACLPWLPLLTQKFVHTTFIPFKQVRTYIEAHTVPGVWFVNHTPLSFFSGLLPDYVFLIICDWRLREHKLNSLTLYNLRLKHIDSGGCTDGGFQFSVFTAPQSYSFLNPKQWPTTLHFPFLTHINAASSVSSQNMLRYRASFDSGQLSHTACTSINGVYDAHGLAPFQLLRSSTPPSFVLPCVFARHRGGGMQRPLTLHEKSLVLDFPDDLT